MKKIAAGTIKELHEEIKTLKGWENFEDADTYFNSSKEEFVLMYDKNLDYVSIVDKNGHEHLSFS